MLVWVFVIWVLATTLRFMQSPHLMMWAPMVLLPFVFPGLWLTGFGRNIFPCPFASVGLFFLLFLVVLLVGVALCTGILFVPYCL